MVFKSKKGYYEMLVNFKDAFNLTIFEEAYIEECFDKYPYVVGDLSDNILRLKGFSTDAKSPNFFRNIEKYIEESCAFEAPYYILRRVHSEEEYKNLEAKNKPVDLGKPIAHQTLEKENFDKETLVLESTPKEKPRIVLDPNKLNRVPIGTLPSELKEGIEPEEKTVTVITASEGFVPNQKRPFNNNNNRKKNKDKRRNSNRKEV